MAEYKTRYSKEEKRQKLHTFNTVYYDGNPNDWKVSRLPNWMEFYGYSLDQELKNKQPSYYRKLKQRMIVMVDYGVTVGREMGGKHFGVVMSSHDNKYKSKAVVVPLSSHYHRGYVDLGLSLFSEISELLNDRLNELQIKIDKTTHDLESFNSKFANKEFVFSKKDASFLLKNNINLRNQLKGNYTFHVPGGNDSLKQLVNTIKSVKNWDHQSSLLSFVNSFNEMDNFDHDIQKKLAILNSEFESIKQLSSKVKKYNKHTYANPAEIRTISKLRIQKFTRFSITGNVQLKQQAFNNLERAVIKNI